jgi:hypothetical protein
MTTTDVPASTSLGTRIPRYGVLVVIAYGICVIGMSLSIVAEMAFGYTGSGDQPRSLGQQLAGVLGFGTLGLLVSVATVARLTSRRQRRVGAMVIGVLTVPSLAFFWCGMPALLGAAAAALAGLTRGRTPLDGAARVFGLVGLAFAVINPIANGLAVTISWLTT